jgi:hypothetical protein
MNLLLSKGKGFLIRRNPDRKVGEFFCRYLALDSDPVGPNEHMPQLEEERCETES